MAVTLPTAALSPPFRALAMSLHARLLQSADSTFPTGPPLLFSAPSNSITVSLDKMPDRGITLARDTLYPDRNIKVPFYLENDVDHPVAIIVC